VASDGTGANSVYTAELLKAIRTPGLTLEGVFKRTGAAVAQVTGRAQVPWFSTSVYGEFVFALPMPGALVTPPAVPAPPRVEIREEIGLGTLAVSSRVPGVDVWLDEQKIGTTRTGGTLIVSNLPAGRHRVTARKDGHQAWEREVEVAANQRNEVVIDIAPLVPPILKGDDGTEMVLVPAGEFTMGSNEGEDEKPLRRIYLDAFYIDRHETTNALYRRFVDSTGRATLAHWNDPKLDGASQPVVGVSWHDAATYCRWVGKRLPTEAEWEKAARGTDGRRYPWGEDWNRSLATFLSWQGKTLPVGSHPFGASPYHALDMAGNASEWVADWYEKDYYQRSPSRNPQGPESGTTRVMRGGSFFSVQYSLRTTFRTSYPPGSQFEFAGFRCAKGLQP
jgi:formylglycine-generating enzyme required for sulfatase activity